MEFGPHKAASGSLKVANIEAVKHHAVSIPEGNQVTIAMGELRTAYPKAFLQCGLWKVTMYSSL